MADQFLGEIRQTGFNYAPYGWALCQGQLMSITRNTPLFSLLGINFGGDGRTTFGLPNLCGRVALGTGNGAGLSHYTVGETGGVASATLLPTQMPVHSHAPSAATPNGGQASPANGIWTNDADSGGTPINGFVSTAPNVLLPPATAAPTGGSQPLALMQPFLTVNYIIALTGNFPTRP